MSRLVVRLGSARIALTLALLATFLLADVSQFVRPAAAAVEIGWEIVELSWETTMTATEEDTTRGPGNGWSRYTSEEHRTIIGSSKFRMSYLDNGSNTSSALTFEAKVTFTGRSEFVQSCPLGPQPEQRETVTTSLTDVTIPTPENSRLNLKSVVLDTGERKFADPFFPASNVIQYGSSRFREQTNCQGDTSTGTTGGRHLWPTGPGGDLFASPDGEGDFFLAQVPVEVVKKTVGPKAQLTMTAIDVTLRVLERSSQSPWKPKPLPLPTDPPCPDTIFVTSVVPVQVIEAAPLVRNKSTAVKVTVQRVCTTDVWLDVSVALEGARFAGARYYVNDSANTNPSTHQLRRDSSSYRLNFGFGETVKAVYFVGPALSPTAGDGSEYVVRATAKRGTSQDSKESRTPIVDTAWPGGGTPDLRVRYVMADFGANPPMDEINTHFLASSSLVRGLFPAAGANVKTELQSLAFEYEYSSAPYRNNGTLTVQAFDSWLRSVMQTEMLLHPLIDRAVIVVPNGWFGTAMAGTFAEAALGFNHRYLRQVSVVELRSSSKLNGPVVTLHELGHSYGLRTEVEEYATTNPQQRDGVGNYAFQGMWVDSVLPISPSTALIDLSGRRIYCFMGSFNVDLEYWIDRTDYGGLLTAGVNGAGTSTSAVGGNALLVGGTVGMTGTVALGAVAFVPDATADVMEPGRYELISLGAGGTELGRQRFHVADQTEPGVTESQFLFFATAYPGTTAIVMTRDGTTVASTPISANDPSVQILSPANATAVRGQLDLRWSATDADGDRLTYTVLLSRDGESWDVVATNLSATSQPLDLAGLAAGEYQVKVLASDGVRVSHAVAGFAVLDTVFVPVAPKAG